MDKNLNASYNNVVDALKCVAISHGMVNNVSSGTVDEVDIDANSVYPLVHIVPGNVTAGVQQLTFEFNIIAMDLTIEKTKPTLEHATTQKIYEYQGNEQQVLSDTMQILIDIIAQYKNGLMLGVQQNDGIYGQADDKDFTLEPFTERFDNVVSGWNCSFSITVPGTYFACNSYHETAQDTGIPFDGSWLFTDNGQVQCREFNEAKLDTQPDVMPSKEVVVPRP